MVEHRSNPPRWTGSRPDGVGDFLRRATEATGAPARWGARERIRSRVLAPRGEARGRWVLGLATTVALAVTLWVLVRAAPAPQPLLEASSGDVSLVRGVAQPGASLPEGSELVTRASGRVRLKLGAGALALGPSTRLRTAHGRVAQVVVGSAELSAPSGHLASVRAGDYEVSVEGGMVRLEVLSAEAVSAVVVEGEAVLRRGSQRVSLHAGQSFQTGATGTSPAGKQVTLRGEPTVREADFAAAPEGSPLERARTEAQSGHTQAAARTYDTLAHGDDGVAAQVALYELARLELTKQGDLVDAERNLRESLRRYPEGVLVQEVSLTLLDVDVRAARPGAALDDADAFLRRFPSTEREADVRMVRANLRRERGDCAGALEDYRRLDANAAHAGDALFFGGLCEAQLGNAGAAHERLSRYLARDGNESHRTEAVRALDSKEIHEGSGWPETFTTEPAEDAR